MMGAATALGYNEAGGFRLCVALADIQTTRARRLEVAEKNNDASRSWPYSHGGIRQLEIATLLSYISLVDPDLFGQFSVFLIECRA